MSSPEENKALWNRYLQDLFLQRDWEKADIYAHPEYFDHNDPPGTPRGPAGVKMMVPPFFEAFPDLKVDVEDLMADGDKVVARWQVTATHGGTWNGIPPTGKQFSVQAVEVMRVQDDQFIERWFWIDSMSMMQQLGLM